MQYSHRRPPELSVIPGEVIRRIILGAMHTCSAIVRDAYRAHAAGRTINSPSTFLRTSASRRSRIIALPAHLEDPSPVSGIKWIASVPGNTASGLARASAVLILNDGETGYPFACLEGSIISAARTAASAALSVGLLLQSRRHLDTLGLVGLGLISRYCLRFIFGTGVTAKCLRVFDTNPEAVGALRGWLDRANLGCAPDISVAGDAEQVVQGSDVSVFATVATEPHVHSAECLRRSPAPIVIHLSLRDLGPQLLLASNNIVDDAAHVLAEGTGMQRAAQLAGHTEFVSGTIADLIEGRCRPDPQKPTIVSPFGLGMLDVAVGRWVYEVARERGELIAIKDFYPLE